MTMATAHIAQSVICRCGMRSIIGLELWEIRTDSVLGFLMSDVNSAKGPSRAKVWAPLSANEPMGRALAEWAYRTPRFPKGIKGSDLLNVAAEVQRETMIVWFLANYVPAEGHYFGFAEAASTGALNTAPLNITPLNSGIKIVGFDQGPFFNGGTSLDLLKAEFKNIVREAALLEVAGLFEGLWQPAFEDAVVDLNRQTPDQLKASLLAAVDDFSETIRKLPTEHGGIGHNRPPEDILIVTAGERELILQTASETKLAVLSSDYGRAKRAWEAALPIIRKIGDRIASQIENLCRKFTSALGSTLGVGVGVLAIAYIGCLLDFWTKAQAISTMLDLATHFSR